jgi:hypothetical protein
MKKRTRVKTTLFGSLILVIIYILYALSYDNQHKLNPFPVYREKNYEKADTIGNKNLENRTINSSAFDEQTELVIKKPYAKLTLGKKAEFRGQSVDSPAFFAAKFDNSWNLENIDFKRNTAFSNCLFGDTLNKDFEHAFGFRNLNFQSLFLFQNIANGGLLFENCIFNEKSFIGPNRFTHNPVISFYFSNFRKGLTVGSAFDNKAFELRDLEGYGYQPSKKKEFQIKRNLLIAAVDFDIYFFIDTLKGTLDVSNCKFSDGKSLIFNSTVLPDTIDLSNTTLSDTLYLTSHEVFQRTQVKSWAQNPFLKFLIQPILDTNRYYRCKINLVGADLKKIYLEYRYFEFYFPKGTTENQISHIYESLLEKYKKDGETRNYENLDIDYHNYQGGLFNFFSKYWWNYGHSKWLIFIWSLIFVIAFTIINYWHFSRILKCYPILSINQIVFSKSELNQPVVRKRKIIASLYYTSILFFGIKLDFEKINFKNLNYSLLVLIQFTLGLVCTGFIIHLIIQ